MTSKDHPNITVRLEPRHSVRTSLYQREMLSEVEFELSQLKRLRAALISLAAVSC